MTQLQSVTGEDLRQLAADILGVSAYVIPRHWIFVHTNQELARAVTIKNACVAATLWQACHSLDPYLPAWHFEYRDNPKQMISQLVSEGLLGPQQGN